MRICDNLVFLSFTSDAVPSGRSKKKLKISLKFYSKNKIRYIAENYMVVSHFVSIFVSRGKLKILSQIPPPKKRSTTIYEKMFIVEVRKMNF